MKYQTFQFEVKDKYEIKDKSKINLSDIII